MTYPRRINGCSRPAASYAPVNTCPSDYFSGRMRAATFSSSSVTSRPPGCTVPHGHLPALVVRTRREVKPTIFSGCVSPHLRGFFVGWYKACRWTVYLARYTPQNQHVQGRSPRFGHRHFAARQGCFSRLGTGARSTTSARVVIAKRRVVRWYRFLWRHHMCHRRLLHQAERLLLPMSPWGSDQCSGYNHRPRGTYIRYDPLHHCCADFCTRCPRPDGLRVRLGPKVYPQWQPVHRRRRELVLGRPDGLQRGEYEQVFR